MKLWDVDESCVWHGNHIVKMCLVGMKCDGMSSSRLSKLESNFVNCECTKANISCFSSYCATLILASLSVFFVVFFNPTDLTVYRCHGD